MPPVPSQADQHWTPSRQLRRRRRWQSGSRLCPSRSRTRSSRCPSWSRTWLLLCRGLLCMQGLSSSRRISLLEWSATRGEHQPSTGICWTITTTVPFRRLSGFIRLKWSVMTCQGLLVSCWVFQILSVFQSLWEFSWESFCEFQSFMERENQFCTPLLSPL